MLMFLLFFSEGLYIFCATDVPNFDVDIRYYSALGKESRTYVRNAGRLVFDDAGCGQSLYAALSDQLLKGFQFLPKIDASKGGEGLLLPEVRRYICAKEDFFSDGIYECLKVIEMFLCEGPGCRTSWMQASRAPFLKDLYPEGKDRRWCVVNKKDARPRIFVDHVYILLSQEDDALCGVLCDRRSVRASKTPDLLDFKMDLSLRCVREKVCDKGALEDARKRNALESFASGCGVGVVCCGQDGAQKSALYDVCGSLTIGQAWMSVAYAMEIPAFESFRLLTLSGYSLKCPLWTPPTFRLKGLLDVNLFFRPDVRDAVCDKVTFPAKKLLDRVLTVLPQKEVDARIADWGFGVLKPKDIQKLFSGNSWGWTPIDKKEAFVKLSSAEKPTNCLYLFFQREDVALCGASMDRAVKETGCFDKGTHSLGACASWHRLLAACQRGQYEGALRVRGVKDLRRWSRERNVCRRDRVSLNACVLPQILRPFMR